MRVTSNTIDSKFKPVEFHITIESPEELRVLQRPYFTIVQHNKADGIIFDRLLKLLSDHANGVNQ